MARRIGPFPDAHGDTSLIRLFGVVILGIGLCLIPLIPVAALNNGPIVELSIASVAFIVFGIILNRVGRIPF